MNRNGLTPSRFRFLLILAAFVIMMIISIYQYSWFLFAYVIQKHLKWNLAQIGLTFTIFTYNATFIQPFSGFIADTYGPRKISLAASLLVGIGFILSSYSFSPHGLYLFYGLGGLGVGILYGISTSCAIKWFPEKRGLVTGVVVFGFGAGTAFFNWFIQRLLESKGLQSSLMSIGFLMLITLIPLSLFHKYPPKDSPSLSSADKKTVGTSSNFAPNEMFKTHQWYLIYFSFTVTVSIVLMFGAQMKMLAKEFDLPRNYFDLLLVLFPLGNGLSRVIAGAVSDQIGREKTMMIFYAFLGISILCFVGLSHIPLLFVALVFIATLLGGAPFALYPAIIGDYYGIHYSTTNYGLTYTAKSWAGLVSGWLSGYLVMQFGSYKIPLIFIALGSLLAALLSSPYLLKAPIKKKNVLT